MSWVVCGKNHTTRVKRPWGLSVMTTGKVWGDKRGKNKAWELGAHTKNLSRVQCLFRVPCMVLRALCCLPVYPLLRSSKQTQRPFQSNSHGQTDTGSSAGQRLTRNNNRQAEKQAG